MLLFPSSAPTCTPGGFVERLCAEALPLSAVCEEGLLWEVAALQGVSTPLLSLSAFNVPKPETSPRGPRLLSISLTC